MKEFFETMQNVSLGLFVNGSFAIMQEDLRIVNFYIMDITTFSMYIFSFLKRRV